jgi:glucose/arabinose dehydrogenase
VAAASLLAAGPVAATVGLTTTLLAGSLDRLLDIQNAGDGSGRLFLVVQDGVILIYDGAQVLPTPFLDVTTLTTFVGERGLLGLAFHPDYATNGFLFVHYTDPAGDTVVARYQVSTDPNVVSPASATTILTLDQPFDNHNGGQLRFGPDGLLYISLGDGGSSGDPQNQGQSLGTLFGSILRLNVDGALPYEIPPDNPFVGTPGARGEIWAWGLRNPWRFSFDRLTGDLLVADVGQGAWEEVNLQAAGAAGGQNYGWRRMEGRHCFNPSSGCNDGTLTLPILEYPHTLGCSVTGGFRYRGSMLAGYVGAYIFTDFCTARIWAAVPGPDGRWTATQAADLPFSVSAFGEDDNGELYVARYGPFPGALHRLVLAESPTPVLTLTLAGSGRGQISSSPVAVACGSICGAHFAADTLVTLSAAADPGFTFQGYLGHADCADGVILLAADRACTAVFGAAFTDDPLLAGSTVVKTIHVTELRARIDALRSVVALPPFTWTDATLLAGATTVRAVHVGEMRAALDEAFGAAGQPTPAYTDPALGPGAPIRAVHVAELRLAVVDLESP